MYFIIIYISDLVTTLSGNLNHIPIDIGGFSDLRGHEKALILCGIPAFVDSFVNEPIFMK